MSLYRRGKIYWCKWEIGGDRISETTRTSDYTEAQEYHDQRRAELWRERRLDQKQVSTWDQAVIAWMDNHASQKKSYADDIIRLRWLNPKLTGRKIDAIDTDLMIAIRNERRKDNAASTCNKYLSIVSGVLRHAHERGQLPGVPKVPWYATPRGKFRFLTREEATKLIAELPDHLAAMARLSLATGLRRGNVTGLRWENVDLGRRIAWVWPEEAKAAKAIPIPLNDAAVDVLREQLGIHPEFVFAYKEAPIWHVKTKAWDKACRRADLDPKEVDFHTMRHTWASWKVMAGTPLEVLMKLGGWGSMEMVLIYAHLAPNYLARFASAGGYNFATVDREDSEESSQHAESMGWLMGLEPTTTGITKRKTGTDDK